MTNNTYSNKIAQIKANLQKELKAKEKQEKQAIAHFFTNWEAYTK